MMRHGAVQVATVAALVVAGCAGGEAGGDDGAAAGPEVTCTVGHRTDVTEPLESEEGIDVPAGETVSRTFAEVEVTFTYDDHPHEVPALRIDAAVPGGDELLSRDLYQFDGTEPPASFAGDTGFTGLSYLYPPGSSAEVQYLCTAG